MQVCAAHSTGPYSQEHMTGLDLRFRKFAYSQRAFPDRLGSIKDGGLHGLYFDTRVTVTLESPEPASDSRAPISGARAHCLLRCVFYPSTGNTEPVGQISQVPATSARSLQDLLPARQSTA